MRAFAGFFLLLIFCFAVNDSSYAQYGYSPFIESVENQITESSLNLHVRQLSGDTSVTIGGVVQTITSRNYGNAGNHKAAQLILEKFQSYGISAEMQNYRPNGYNVVATKSGTVYPNEQFIICAHYDDMPTGTTAPGADDNASGVATVLEAARILNQYSFDYTLKFIAFDEEELGLYGSWAYADTAYKYGVIIRGVINLDMIAWDGNNDYEISVGSNETSMPLMESFTDILRIYQPVLSPHLIIATASDHARFWNRNYQALLAIEEYPGDFNPRYHTVNDLFQYVNRPYFLTIARGSVAALAAMARGYKINMSHVPLSSDRFTGERNVNLVMNSPHPVDVTNYKPRLYYKIDQSSFNFITPYIISGDTFKFIMPGQQAGTKVSYYFAAQDASGQYSVTLPESGKGISPPGTVPPPVYYSYYVLNDTTVNVCATGLPMAITANQTVYKTLSVSQAGQLLDLNVSLSLTHTNDKDVNLYLISPSGRQVMLSTKNGTSLDHYASTVFDDEASKFIYQGRPPYTGSFRPEQPLALFDDTVSNGNWQLKIVNAGGTAGSLTSFCLIMNLADDDYYVDASKAVSGNGRSWSTAFRSISEATALEPSAGSVVFIKPGIYNEDINITSNGQVIVSLQTGVAVSDHAKIQFPAGTSLAGIDLVNHPGEYYAYVFRSRYFNNGCFQVKSVNDDGDYVLVNYDEFLDEYGISNDSSYLSAMICRPVIYTKYSLNPVSERITVDANSDPDIITLLYIGEAIGDGSSDAFPADYNIIDGIDLTGSALEGGIHLQSSSFNIIKNSKIYNLNGAGIHVNGNSDHPSHYNLISGNEFFNTASEGIYIGNAGFPAINNQAHYTHLLNNEIYSSGSGSEYFFENAVDISEFNKGTFLQGNFIHDIDLITEDNGAVCIHEQADGTVLNGNVLKNIGRSGIGLFANVMASSQVENLEIYNNLIFSSEINDDDVYALRIDGTGHNQSFLIHNTVYQVDNGLMLEDYGAAPDVTISNNIFNIHGEYFTSLGTEGRFPLSHNYYYEDPAPESWMPYYAETGRQTGLSPLKNPASGDFSITVNDGLLIGNGTPIDSILVADKSGYLRDAQQPDIGAYELTGKVIWTGIENQDWTASGNWKNLQIPENQSNVVIQPSSNDPVLNIDAVIHGLLIRPGAQLIIPSGRVLLQSE